MHHENERISNQKDEIYKLLKEKYFLPHEKSWNDLAKRVSGIHPDIFNDIYPLISNMYYIPSTPTLLNANTNGLRVGTLSSCFIVDINDSMSEIMETMEETALITQKAGGVGANFSKLRSSREMVKSTGRFSGGPLPFIGIYNSVLNGVRQGGARMGAGMVQLNINHGDIDKFIVAKHDQTSYSRTNFSIGMFNRFYRTLINNPDEILMYKEITTGSLKPLMQCIDGKDVPYTHKQFWDKLIYEAWHSGDPGLFNLDYATERCTCKHKTSSVYSNPCAEFVHIPYTSCNLASIVLSNLVKYGKIDWKTFDEIITIGTRFQNYVIDCNIFPIEKIKEATLNTRPIGIGMMGLATALYMMKIPYNSKEAYDLAAYAMKRMTLVSMRESVNLAKKLGAYPYYDYNTFMDANNRYFENTDDIDYIDMKTLMNDIKQYGCYNSCQTSEAPNGSIGTIVDVSTGIEPIYSLMIERKIEQFDGNYKIMSIIDPVFDKYIDQHYKDKKNNIYSYIENNRGSCKGCSDLSEEEQKIFVVAHDIKPIEHIDMMSGVAKWVSLSVSKTINLPNNATKEQIGEVYLEAWKRGIIGVTIYRDGSRKQILTSKGSANTTQITKTDAPKRPLELNGDMHHLTMDKIKYFVAVGLMGKDPYEIFFGKNYDDDGDVLIPKSVQKGLIRRIERGHYIFVSEEGKEYRLVTDNSAEAFTRVLSWGLRHGADNKFAVHQLEKTKGPFNTMNKAIARCLKKYIIDGTEITGEECPNCKSVNLIREAGCKKCIDCNTSICG